jgi:hypothetical protein
MRTPLCANNTTHVFKIIVLSCELLEMSRVTNNAVGGRPHLSSLRRYLALFVKAKFRLSEIQSP